MYCKHFGIDSKPFSITPDPRFLFLSERHREALAHLVYGVGEGGGFVQLTGEVGTGKTTLCRALLEQLPEKVDVALILNPKLSGLELVAAICDELNVDYPQDTQSLKVLIDRLNHHLLQSHAAGRRTVAVIDEAQNLSTDVLEQVRLLTNLETAQAKLLQIILIGQPELQALLAQDDLRQLAQRITARYHLGELDRDEIRSYIAHRLRVAGGRPDLFETDAVDEIYRLSGGIPRLVNVICDRALLGAYVEDRQSVDRRIVRRAAEEVLPESSVGDVRDVSPWPWAVAMALLLAAAGGGWFMSLRPSAMDTAVADDHSAADATRADRISASPEHAIDVVAPGSSSQPDVAGEAAVPVLAVGEPLQTLPGTDRPEPVAITPALADRLTAANESDEELRAWSGLFKLWGAEFFLENNSQPCDQAVRAGLRCVMRSGNWTQVRSFDRPVILQMVAPDGTRVPLLLRGFDSDAAMATIELSGEVLQVPAGEVDAHWHGQYTLIWRPPVSSDAMRIGARSDDVVWLRELLDRLQPESASAPPDVVPNLFDSGLAERVRRFQVQHSLEPDGVVGAMTLMHLNASDSRSGGPRLSMKAG